MQAPQANLLHPTVIRMGYMISERLINLNCEAEISVWRQQAARVTNLVRRCVK